MGLFFPESPELCPQYRKYHAAFSFKVISTTTHPRKSLHRALEAFFVQVTDATAALRGEALLSVGPSASTLQQEDGKGHSSMMVLLPTALYKLIENET